MENNGSEAFRFPVIYGSAQAGVTPSIAPVVIAPFGRQQDIPIIAPASVSKKAYEFIGELYRPVTAIQPGGTILRLFRFDQRLYMMVVFVTTATERSSGRTGLCLSMGAGLAQTGKRSDGHLAGSYLETLFRVFNRLFSVSLPTSGSEKVIEAVQKIETGAAAIEPFHAAKDTLLLAAEALDDLGTGTLRRWPYKIDLRMVGSSMPRMIIHSTSVSKDQLIAIILREMLAASESSTAVMTREMTGAELAGGGSIQLVALDNLPNDLRDVRIRAGGRAAYMVVY